MEGLAEVKEQLKNNRLRVVEEKRKKREFLKAVQEKMKSVRTIYSSEKLEGLINTLNKDSKKPETAVFPKQNNGLWPVKGKILLGFGKKRDKSSGLNLVSKGIIIKSKAGEPIAAVFRGKAVFAEQFKGYGKLVIIDHGGGYYTLYGYLDKIKIREKDNVKKGEIIGLTKGTSLYFELRKKGRAINPLEWLNNKQRDITHMITNE